MSDSASREAVASWGPWHARVVSCYSAAMRHCFSLCVPQAPAVSSTESRQHRDDCPFCSIAKGVSAERCLFSDDRVVAFKDRSPAADVHLLVCPREHAGAEGSLTADDASLVRHMHEVGLRLLREARPEAEHKLGYHANGFHSVEHLHLHCFALPHQPWWLSWKYAAGSPWWRSSEEVIRRLTE